MAQHKVSNYVQISIFDKVSPNNCYHCVMFESFRCRGGAKCPEGLHYEEYTGSIVRQCLSATTEVYQDGYIHCPIIESVGCKKCMDDFGDGSGFVYDESQNYERKPDWREDYEEEAYD